MHVVIGKAKDPLAPDVFRRVSIALAVGIVLAPRHSEMRGGENAGFALRAHNSGIFL